VEPQDPVEKKSRLDDSAGPSSSGGAEGGPKDGRGGDGRAVRERKTDEAMEKRHVLLASVPEGEIKALNRQKILTDMCNQFFCVLCSSKLAGVESLGKHVVGLEHERKAKMYINWSRNKERFPLFCEV
jgi:hypothetical protein